MLYRLITKQGDGGERGGAILAHLVAHEGGEHDVSDVCRHPGPNS